MKQVLTGLLIALKLVWVLSAWVAYFSGQLSNTIGYLLLAVLTTIAILYVDGNEEDT